MIMVQWLWGVWSNLHTNRGAVGRCDWGEEEKRKGQEGGRERNGGRGMVGMREGMYTVQYQQK